MKPARSKKLLVGTLYLCLHAQKTTVLEYPVEYSTAERERETDSIGALPVFPGW